MTDEIRQNIEQVRDSVEELRESAVRSLATVEGAVEAGWRYAEQVLDIARQLSDAGDGRGEQLAAATFEYAQAVRAVVKA